MTRPTHFTCQELQLIIDALTEYQPVDPPRQELKRRTLKKIGAVLEI